MDERTEGRTDGRTDRGDAIGFLGLQPGTNKQTIAISISNLPNRSSKLIKSNQYYTMYRVIEKKNPAICAKNPNNIILFLKKLGEYSPTVLLSVMKKDEKYRNEFDFSCDLKKKEYTF